MADYKLDLTKALSALDRRQTNFYKNLTLEEKKGFTPLVLMRYMSSVPDKNDLPYYALVSTNEIVNTHFWELSHEPELQAMLLAACGLGSKIYHKWIPLKSKRSSPLNSFVVDIFESKRWFVNSTEIKLYISMLTKENLTELCVEHGKDDAERKKLIAELLKVQQEL